MVKITIKDVAREAGVSIGTVSNALNNVDVLSPETKERILETARRLNYVPNLNGKYLKSGASKLLGFFTTSMSGAYFSFLSEAMCRQCQKRGYVLNIFVTSDTSMVMSNILGKRLDGVIVFEDAGVGLPEIQLMKENGIKAVFLDREIEDTMIGSVVFNSFQAGYEATRRLIHLGHKKIYFIGGLDNVYDNTERLKGYQAALENAGLGFDPKYVLQGFFEENFTYNTIKSLIRMNPENIPDAFLAGNDLSAVGCIKALQEEGYHVPDDISVIGFDDIEIARYFTPPLTTVRNPIARQGVIAIDMLLGMILEGESGRSVKLESNLVVRNSCTLKKIHR